MSYSKDYKTNERIDEAKNKNTNSPKETQSIGFLYRHRGLFWLGGAIIISSVIIMIFGMTAAVYPEMLESPSMLFFILFVLTFYITTFGSVAFIILCIIYYLKDKNND